MEFQKIKDILLSVLFTNGADFVKASPIFAKKYAKNAKMKFSLLTAIYVLNADVKNPTALVTTKQDII